MKKERNMRKKYRKMEIENERERRRFDERRTRLGLNPYNGLLQGKRDSRWSKQCKTSSSSLPTLDQEVCSSNLVKGFIYFNILV